MSPPQLEPPPGSSFLSAAPVSRRTLLAATGIAAGVALVGTGVLHGESASAAVPAANGYIYPTDPFRMSTEAGGQYLAPREGTRRHMGIDTWGYRGMPILAIAGGQVSGGDWSSTGSDGHGWGHYVQINHGNGVTSRYAHFNGAPTVNMGASVNQGQVIGYMGNSQYGPTSGMGVHLHFEVLVGGSFVNPLSFLQGNSIPPTTEPNPSPGIDQAAIHRRNNNMSSLYYSTINGTTVFALAGDGVGNAGWLETTDQSFANQLAAQHGNAAYLTPGSFNQWKSWYLGQ